MIKSLSINKDEITIIKKQILELNNSSDKLSLILKDFLSRDSKFIRSNIACLFFNTFGYKLTENHYKILTTTELIHNASLIHDDVIDNSIFRSNLSTINSKYDNKLAVISGDLLISKAIKNIISLKNKTVVDIFIDAVMKMCEGEAIQYFSVNKIPSLEEYLTKTQYKTAELFKACFLAITIDYPEIKDLASKFALNFGIAFQLKNDLEDYRKRTSDDINLGIYTAPVILSQSIKYNENAIEKTLNLIDNYVIKAKKILINCEETEYKNSLMGILDKLCS